MEHLNWRYATKQYDTTKKISAEHLDALKTAIQLAPSSYGLQPIKVFVVENPEVRAQLKEKSWGQTQITDASHLFVFAAQKTLTATHIDALVALTAQTRGLAESDLQGYGDFMKNSTAHLTEEQQLAWNTKQAYIALGFLLDEAARLEIDATPMEGFDPAGYNEILGLTDYSAVVVAPVGYRSSEDQLQHAAKVRKSKEELFQTI